MPAKSTGIPKELKLWEENQSSPLDAHLAQRDSVVIGRGFECDIIIKDAKASRRHCKLTRHETSFVLEDLNSKNGTYVNGERIKAPVTLKMNQTFKIGDTVFYLAT